MIKFDYNYAAMPMLQRRCSEFYIGLNDKKKKAFIIIYMIKFVLTSTLCIYDITLYDF